jgi:hypothetical protein
MKTIVFSIGYRCSSAGILKYLDVKTESYPFDWLISRLPIIKDCLETNFQHFLNKDNYQKCDTKTLHYFYSDLQANNNSNNNNNKNSFLICNESIVYNTYYQNKFLKDELIIPSELQLPIDTYSYHLALNHRDILCDNDHVYFKRCINRFEKMMVKSDNKLSLYIHPVLSQFDFENNREYLLNQFIDFHTFLSSTTVSLKGLYILIVKKANLANPFIEKIELNKDLNKDCYSYILYTNEKFIDAGEIFMQTNNDMETRLLIELVKSFIIF